MNHSKLSATSIFILFLGAITAIIHLLQEDLILKFNGLGYLILLGAAFLPQAGLNHYRAAAKQGLLLYVAVTIMMFFLVHQGDVAHLTTGLVAKGIEVGLILMVMLDLQKSTKTRTSRI